MSHLKFRSFGRKEVTKAIEKYAKTPKALKLNAPTIRAIGQTLSGLRDSSMKEAELVELAIIQTLRPVDKRQQGGPVDSRLVVAYTLVVNDLLNHRESSRSSHRGMSHPARPSIQHSVATTA